MIPEINTVIIENVYPEIDNGTYGVKRTVGDTFLVRADIFSHGHNVIQALLRIRQQGEKSWTDVPMIPGLNDRWESSYILRENTTYEYTIFAWRDPFLSWREELQKKHEAKQDITSELLEGKKLIHIASKKADKKDATFLKKILTYFDKELEPFQTTENLLKLVNDIEKKIKKDEPVETQLKKVKELLEDLIQERSVITPASDPVRDIFMGEELKTIMMKYPDQSDCGKYDKILTVFVNRKQGEFGSWYEMWHRSQGKIEGKSATFDDMIERLDDIKEMGFDIIYLPPIHPVGLTNRKGPNNSLICPPGSPGSSFAIGSPDGGHMDVNPEFGTIDDFRRLIEACKGAGMEIALDLALQTSPDHPWVKEHPEWFYHRPDGTIKYAENPPKKYEDIYPLNFNTPDKAALWKEIRTIVRFWMNQGIRIFRVDNPHTKPVHFWKWLIDDIHGTDPDIIFLSEAFTKPKMMKVLAKAGFTQSYTYFTWRNFKYELEEYFTELTQSSVAEYMVGNLFTNTPDILPLILQNGPRSAFKMRAVLGATLSSTWGIYNGFELCEGKPKPGTEEYMNSEKYQYKVWDWSRSGNIKDFIKRLNRIRKENPALQQYKNLRFHKAENDNIIFYTKKTEDKGNIILIAVNLNPYKKQESFVYIPIEELDIKADESYNVIDLITGQKFYWKGSKNFISLDPEKEPAHILKISKWSSSEQNFDYYY